MAEARAAKRRPAGMAPGSSPLGRPVATASNLPAANPGPRGPALPRGRTGAGALPGGSRSRAGKFPADSKPATKRTPVSGRRPANGSGTRAVRSVGASARKAPSTVGKTIRKGQQAIATPAPNPEKILAVEMVVTLAVYLGLSIYHSKMPSGRRVAATLGVYAILGVVTMFGTKWGRVAYLLGGLIVLTTVLVPLGEALAPAPTASAKNAAKAAFAGLKTATVLTGG